MGMGTCNKGIAAFNLVDKAVGEEKIQCPVNRDGRWPVPVHRHALDNIIGTHGRMALRHARQDIAALPGKLAAAPLAGALGPCNQIGRAMGVVMVGIKECHDVII